jgi:alkylated DNA nucleotide flippase Atl1
MFREPWFSIIEVHEHRGRSMADIAAEIVKAHGADLKKVRAGAYDAVSRQAREACFLAIRAERPDLHSGIVGKFFNRDPTKVRLVWHRGTVNSRPRVRQKAWDEETRERIAEALRGGASYTDLAGMVGLPYNVTVSRVFRDPVLKAARAAA